MSTTAYLAALISLVGLVLGSFPQLGVIGSVLASLVPVAVLLGVLSCWKRRSGFGVCAIVLGALVSLYLASLWLPVVMRS